MQDFITLFVKAVTDRTFLKATLSKPSKHGEVQLKNLYFRPVVIKEEDLISITFRFATKDETKNIRATDLADFLAEQLAGQFREAVLFTKEKEIILKMNKKGKARIFQKKNTTADAQLPDASHNRRKNRLLNADEPWLVDLKIANTKGEILKNAQDKWRQINKFLEIVESLLADSPLSDGCRIADMGSGKGYLTFALFVFLKKNKHLKKVQLTGVELRTDLVAFCNTVAAKYKMDGLTFVAQDIAAFEVPTLDMLIALHACDTATDLAIAQGLARNAHILILAPCCHKQIRKAMQPQNALASILKHGILMERQAEMLTDGIRALLLEAEGYKTKVFQFVSAEHTAKNVMITATKRKHPSAQNSKKALEEVAALKKDFGIETHFLETLLP